MRDGIVFPPKSPQAVGQTLTRTHVRPGFNQSPEVAHLPVEESLAEMPSSGIDALLIQEAGVLCRPRLNVRQHRVGIRTIGRMLQRLSGQRRRLPVGRGFPSLIDQGLSLSSFSLSVRMGFASVGAGELFPRVLEREDFLFMNERSL